MSNESEILAIDAGVAGKTATGTVALVNTSGLQLVFVGASTTRAAVFAECGAAAAIGAIYLSTAGKQYVKTANAGALTDWQRTTTTAAD